MGHTVSKSIETSSSSSSDESSPVRNDGKISRRKSISKLMGNLHLHRSDLRDSVRRRLRRKPSNSDRDISRLLAADDFAGIVRVRLIGAEMHFEDKWMACLSFGEQTYKTDVSDNTMKPIWNSEKKLLIESKGPRLARISVYETNRLSKNNLIGYCEIDLLDVLFKDCESKSTDHKLLDPSTSEEEVGILSISYTFEDPTETKQSFTKRLLSLADSNADGTLSLSEFSQLIDAFGNQVAAKKKEELFKAADKNGDNSVSIDELAVLLADQQDKEPLINCCPVCGENLEVSDELNSMIHLTLCFDEGTGNQIMTGGFLTEKQASYGWMFKLSEWTNYSSYDIGLRSGSSASHIVVFDRRTKRLVEEVIDGKIVLSMRAIYQSKMGLGLINAGVKEILQKLSEKQGRRMESPESVKDIPKFVESYQGQINLAEIQHPLDHFKTFNEFFIRELKPGARPIACMDRDDVAVCAADSRLMAFRNVEDSQRFWIKGRKFSMKGLLGDEISSNAFCDGTLVIFRLAPQDYHRFHFPVSGIVQKFVNIPGCLYTVNPIAVNSKYCNVFTENKRVVSLISTTEFGKVAFVAIGATMVGSIDFTKKKGDHVKKGDEFGYFSFGGSTVICVFEKDSIEIDEDLLGNSERSLETLVSVGMQLGVKKRIN